MMLREAAEELLDCVRAQIDRLRSSPDQAERHFAAAGLMRCCLLLRGILVLEDAGFPHPAGILARQHWETWVLSLYALLGGDDALTEIAGDDIHWKRKLAHGLRLELQYHEDWIQGIDRLNYKAIHDRVLRLLEETGEPRGEGPTGYDLTYRTQSLFSTHANLATLGAHMLNDEEPWGVRLNPAAPFPGMSIQVSALHTSHLASHVFRAFALATDQIDALDSILLGLGESGVPRAVS